MFGPTQYRDLVSGRSRGAKASLLRGMLRLGEIPYTAAVRWRNLRYDQGHCPSIRVPVPVVSVGNLTLGGTGKTPLVLWIATWLLERGVRVALVSRGYGAERGGANDEARELAGRLSGVPHVQNPDRVAAAREAIARHAAQLILLDDGFQHRRLARDLDIVLLDALEPLGFGHVFPRGMLREPLAGLKRADVLALSRADLIEPAERAALHEQLLAHAPAAAWCELTHDPQALVDSHRRHEPLGMLAGRSVAAFCGIGNPEGFRRTLDQCGYRTAVFREFADHHRFGPRDVESLDAWAGSAPVDAVVCTGKDLVKLSRPAIGGRPLWAVTIAVGFRQGCAELEERLQALLAQHGLA